MPVGTWLWNKDVHGVTGTYPIEPGKSRVRTVILVIGGKTVKPGQSYTLVASYMSLTEGKYAVAPVKTVEEKGDRD
jgi:hypothetical protein